MTLYIDTHMPNIGGSLPVDLAKLRAHSDAAGPRAQNAKQR
jgi:hypothetical protein